MSHVQRKLSLSIGKMVTSQKWVVDFLLDRDTFRNKIMELVEDFDEKNYRNNGKPWKSSRILRVKPNFFIFLHFSFVFIFSSFSIIFLHFLHCSSFLHFFILFIFHLFLHFSAVFIFILFLFYYFSSFSFMFCHFPFILFIFSFFSLLIIFMMVLHFSFFTHVS